MTISVPMLAGAAIGCFVLGAVLAGFVLMGARPHPWLVFTRIPAPLYDRLRRAARWHNTSIRDEIETRLENSFNTEKKETLTTIARARQG
jgi:hypothetical protein